jgi:nucleoside-diphosphate-sugar epimerase
MRCLVTGCAGFIGSQLTESLLSDGVGVIGVDCFNDNYGRSQKLRNLRRVSGWVNFEFAPIDLSRGDLRELVAECDVVYHLAAEPGVRASWGGRFESYVRNNVQATQHLLEAAKQEPVMRFVYASSSSVYGQAESMPTSEDAIPRPFSPYGVTKLSAEHLASLYHDNYGVPTVSLRFFSVYGPRQRPDMAFNIFCRAALRGDPIQVFGDGRQTRDFTYVGDIVAALRSAARAPAAAGRVYNIGGGSQVSLAHTLDLLRGMVDAPLDVTHLPMEAGDVRDTGADISRARRDLGYRPATGIEEGLAAELQWTIASLRSEPGRRPGQLGAEPVLA